MKNLFIRFARFINGLRRPSQRTNTRLIQQRGENLSLFKFRDAKEEEIPALADLHVITWHQTYNAKPKPEAWKIRDWQWREQLKVNDGSWFCIVIENEKGELIGFAKGKTYSSPDLPEYSGDLNKIYLLRDYQRMGLGRKLVGHVARRFLSMGVNSMVLFGSETNPSNHFHEKLEGKPLIGDKGEFYGNYGWKDLNRLAAICPID